MKLETQIFNHWTAKGMIPVEKKAPHSLLYKTAKRFAKAISEMDCNDNEKIHFARTITKIYAERGK